MTQWVCLTGFEGWEYLGELLGVIVREGFSVELPSDGHVVVEWRSDVVVDGGVLAGVPFGVEPGGSHDSFGIFC